MQNVMPALRITDYAGSMAFHLYGLGFRADWEHRLEPYLTGFAQIIRARPHLLPCRAFQGLSGWRVVPLFASNVDEWHGELLSKGIPV